MRTPAHPEPRAEVVKPGRVRCLCVGVVRLKTDWDTDQHGPDSAPPISSTLKLHCAAHHETHRALAIPPRWRRMLSCGDGEMHMDLGRLTAHLGELPATVFRTNHAMSDHQR